mmetsp:Transcript_28708/g.45814  ORF Transcript_28708/g.45814 Transcript_28708/m.45814 type:complete len:256 (+) Transcript_28708:8190-8957(+)
MMNEPYMLPLSRTYIHPLARVNMHRMSFAPTVGLENQHLRLPMLRDLPAVPLAAVVGSGEQRPASRDRIRSDLHFVDCEVAKIILAVRSVDQVKRELASSARGQNPFNILKFARLGRLALPLYVCVVNDPAQRHSQESALTGTACATSPSKPLKTNSRGVEETRGSHRNRSVLGIAVGVGERHEAMGPIFAAFCRSVGIREFMRTTEDFPTHHPGLGRPREFAQMFRRPRVFLKLDAQLQLTRNILERSVHFGGP